MRRMGLEPAIPEFERAKTVHDLDGAATVIGTFIYVEVKICAAIPSVTNTSPWHGV
jgi:hypothetical protein